MKQNNVTYQLWESPEGEPQLIRESVVHSLSDTRSLSTYRFYPGAKITWNPETDLWSLETEHIYEYNHGDESIRELCRLYIETK